MHSTMVDFINTFTSDDSMLSYRKYLRYFETWLTGQNLDPLTMTTEQLQAYQRWLADGRRAQGKSLARTTQRTRIAVVCGYYRFLTRRGLILFNPASDLKLPRVSAGPTRKDYLTLQEAIALLQTQAGRMAKRKPGSYQRAVEHRNLAILCLALATGRRLKGLVSIRVQQLNLERNELRVEYEKGRVGRVLPIKGWATTVLAAYLKDSRPRLLVGRTDEGWLFVGNRNDHVAAVSYASALTRLHVQAAAENEDLEGFAEKNISPHCLRVSFATLLFTHGCNIRTINELMLHSKLSTTARYTPIPLEDLRRACRLAHPRA